MRRKLIILLSVILIIIGTAFLYQTKDTVEKTKYDIIYQYFMYESKNGKPHYINCMPSLSNSAWKLCKEMGKRNYPWFAI